jgi:hypothetical protein
LIIDIGVTITLPRWRNPVNGSQRSWRFGVYRRTQEFRKKFAKIYGAICGQPKP